MQHRHSWEANQFSGSQGTHAFCGIRSCARHLSLSWARSIQSITPHPTSRPVPVTTAWRVLSLRVEELCAPWRVAGNILKEKSPTADKGWSCRFGFGQGANNSLLQNPILLQTFHQKWSKVKQSAVKYSRHCSNTRRKRQQQLPPAAVLRV